MIPLIAAGVGMMAAGFAATKQGAETAIRRQVPAPATTATGFNMPVRLTGYYPRASYATAAEARMEGGQHDSQGRSLITLQQHAADPLNYPYVSLAGDVITKVNPGGRWFYGQRVLLPALGTPPPWWQQKTGQRYYIGRLVDTGCHFFDNALAVKQCGRGGARKVIHTEGHEPIDVAVQDAAHGFSGKLGQMALVPGDLLDPRTGRPARSAVA